MPKTDTHKLPEQPGAAQKAGTAGKVKKVSRATFNSSIGHGAAGGGTQLGYGASGDQSLAFPVGPGRPKPMGRGGKFGTPFHQGKQPLTYEYGDGPEEY